MKQLELEVNIRDGQVLLLYGMNHEGKTREQLQLKGALTHWEPASLTYHMALDQGQLLVDVTQAELSTHLQQVMLAGRAPLLRGEAIILSFQLLEKLADRALLGFPDSSALWNCDVKKSGGL
ncbi:hypothetical protein [Shewanella sp.]|uniref:hypothetical protein n=1 Tax=Shewanella sp. TaxID=50422 RepID=UPI003568EB04